MVHTKDKRYSSYKRQKRCFVPEIIEMVHTKDNRDDSSSRDSADGSYQRK